MGQLERRKRCLLELFNFFLAPIDSSANLFNKVWPECFVEVDGVIVRVQYIHIETSYGFVERNENGGGRDVSVRKVNEQFQFIQQLAAVQVILRHKFMAC